MCGGSGEAGDSPIAEMWKRVEGNRFYRVTRLRWGEKAAADEQESSRTCVCFGEWRRDSMSASRYLQKIPDENFSVCIAKLLQSCWNATLHWDVKLLFVNSSMYWTGLLWYYDIATENTKYVKEERKYQNLVQPDFRTVVFGGGKRVKNNFILVGR